MDHKFAAHGQPYSFPPGVKGQCDTSKSYHFWMSAYLAHQATLSTGDPEAAMAAAFSANKAYQNVGNYSARGAGTILTHSPFSPASQIVRADLSYAAAGSAFGALRAMHAPANLSTDDGVGALIDAAKAQRPLTRDEVGSGISLGNYQRWSDTFAPNTLYARTAGQLIFPARAPKAAVVPPAVPTLCK